MVIDKDDYKTKVKQMLSDTKTYEVLKKHPTPTYKRKLVSILSPLKQEKKSADNNMTTCIQRRRIFQGCTAHLRFTNREHAPLRPIVDYTGSIGYSTSKALG